MDEGQIDHCDAAHAVAEADDGAGHLVAEVVYYGEVVAGVVEP